MRSFPSSEEQAILSPTLEYVIPASSSAFAMDEIAISLTSFLEESDKPIPATCADGTGIVFGFSAILCVGCWRCTPLIFGRQTDRHTQSSVCMTESRINCTVKVGLGLCFDHLLVSSTNSDLVPVHAEYPALLSEHKVISALIVV